MMENNTDPRPPLSPALLAQAASVERGVCFGYDADQHVIGPAMPSERGQVIVTWRGTGDRGADEIGD